MRSYKVPRMRKRGSGRKPDMELAVITGKKLARRARVPTMRKRASGRKPVKELAVLTDKKPAIFLICAK